MNSKIAGFVLSGALLFLPVATVRAQTPEKLSLQQAVGLALKNSRDIELARVQYTVAQNQSGVDRAAFRPNLYTGSGLAYSNGFPETPGGAAPSVFNLSYTQAVFDPMLKGRLRADEDLARNQELKYEATRDAVIVRAATSYLELAKVRHSLDLLRTERTSAQKILTVTQERAAAGLELPIEITRRELDLAKIEQRIVELESRDEILTDQLRDLTGMPPDQPIEVSAEELPVGAAQPANELLDAALQHSPAIKEAENERSAQQHLLKGARGSYWPAISLVGEYSVLSKINNYDLFFRKFQRNNVNFGLQITIPVFSARTSANVALARSQLTAAELQLSDQRRAVRIDTEQKIRTVREKDAAREVARLDLQLAQQTLQITQARFDQDRASLREVEQARLDENEKWLAFLDADFAREQAQLALLQATGELGQVFH